jgi:hypothetical protein
MYPPVAIQILGLSPLRDPHRFPVARVKLTYGRRASRLHQYPACGGQGLRRARPICSAAVEAMLHLRSPTWICRD